jgi:hypothetical protein
MNALSLAELGDVLPALGLADETSPCNFLGSFSDRSDLFSPTLSHSILALQITLCSSTLVVYHKAIVPLTL